MNTKEVKDKVFTTESVNDDVFALISAAATICGRHSNNDADAYYLEHNLFTMLDRVGADLSRYSRVSKIEKSLTHNFCY